MGFKPSFPHGEPVPLLSRLSRSVYLHLHRYGSEESAIMFGKTVYGTTFKDVNFVPLQSATFCVQCELISTNSKPYCLACGSHALLGLSRVLGGSLRNQQTAHLITDIELDNLVRDLLRTVPDPEVLSDGGSHSHALPRATQPASRSQCRASRLWLPGRDVRRRNRNSSRRT